MKTSIRRPIHHAVTILLVPVLILGSGFYVECKMRYKEHYKLTLINMDLLQRSGATQQGEPILKPLTSIAAGEEFYLHFRFVAEYFNTDKKTRTYPRYGSLGPLDTIRSFHVTLQLNESAVSLDSILFYECNGMRVQLESPHHRIPAHTLANPMPTFSGIGDFISKYNTRYESVLFDELERNGIVLKGKVVPELSSPSAASIIAVITFSDGRVLTDTLQTQLAAK